MRKVLLTCDHCGSEGVVKHEYDCPGGWYRLSKERSLGATRELRAQTTKLEEAGEYDEADALWDRDGEYADKYFDSADCVILYLQRPT